MIIMICFFFSSRRRHTRSKRDWSSDVCSSDLGAPVQMGFIASLAHPGGNVTGLSGIDAEIGGKRLQLLKQLIPNLNRVAVPSATHPYGRPFVEDLQAAAARAGIRLVPAIVGGVNDFESAFATMAKERAQ